ncbi:outer membrane exchange protein TraA family protein [Sorangium sp. So ce542]|uniref:outer membrane exchange protein TraA family protein n=1 Tax=Sorangium sp. So ce542 TaxID=3133316 RepID=UPI003F6082B0
MSLRPSSLTVSSVIALSLALGASGSASAEPVIITGDPVAPLPAEKGAGLCGAHRISTDPEGDFYVSPATAEGFIEKMTAFFDAGQPETDIESFVVSAPLDFSNNYAVGNEWSFGDFLNAAPECSEGGCDFESNEPSVSFGVRLRGYLAVPAEHVDQPVHFGIFADDAVALVLYDAEQAAYPVLAQPLKLGLTTWRMTNTVTFAKEGLYPVEVLYAGIAEHSALEVSLLVGEFEDFQLGAGESGSVSLAESGFAIVEPASLYQALSGGDANADEASCTQCGREFIHQVGNNGCAEGSYCNSAALCAPCSLDEFCGPTCRRCDAQTPRCAVVEGTPECVACVSDGDCDDGEVCDLEAHACVEAPDEPGAGGAGGAGGDGAGATVNPGPDGDDGGCGVSGERRSGGGLAFALAGLGLALAGARRRARAASRSSALTERASR